MRSDFSFKNDHENQYYLLYKKAPNLKVSVLLRKHPQGKQTCKTILYALENGGRLKMKNRHFFRRLLCYVRCMGGGGGG